MVLKHTENGQGVIHALESGGYYASCAAGGCTWVGPTRRTVGWAMRDARQHAES